jgi:hypothetical protein
VAAAQCDPVDQTEKKIVWDASVLILGDEIRNGNGFRVVRGFGCWETRELLRGVSNCDMISQRRYSIFYLINHTLCII